MQLSQNSLENSSAWQRLEEINAIEYRLSKSPCHRAQLCDRCRTATYPRTIDPSSSTSSSNNNSVDIGLFSSLLIKQDWCNICNFIVRSCQATLSDTEFQSVLRSGHSLSLAQIPATSTPFWHDVYLQQKQEIQDQSLILGNDTSNLKQSSNTFRITRIGVGPYGAQSNFLDWAFWEKTSVAHRKYFNWVGRPDPPDVYICIEQVLRWIHKCTTEHGEACNEGPDSLHASFMVIDVYSRQIHALRNGERFAALSYVWGDKARCKSSSDATVDHLPSRACRTIEDAILITRKLGLRYLWVDRYCIATDTAEKYTQIRHMSEVYEAAHVTIMALEGTSCESGIPGVSKPLRRISLRRKTDAGTLIGGKVLDPIRASNGTVWKERAWTLQEAAMSRRRLGFLNDMIFLECNDELFLDYLDLEQGFEPIKPCLRLDGVSYGSSIVRQQWNFEKYASLIEDYTRRKITFQSDALAAIEGILAHITKKKTVQFLWGHPVDDFAYSLLWECAECKLSTQSKRPNLLRRVDGPPTEHRDISFRPSMYGRRARPPSGLRPIDPMIEDRLRNHEEDSMHIQKQYADYPCPCAKRRHGFPAWCWAGWRGSVFFPFKILGSFEAQGHHVIAARCGEDELGSYFQEKEKIRALADVPESDGIVKFRTFIGKLQPTGYIQPEHDEEEQDQTLYDIDSEQSTAAASALPYTRFDRRIDSTALDQYAATPGVLNSVNGRCVHEKKSSTRLRLPDIELALIVQWRPCDKEGTAIHKDGHNVPIPELRVSSSYYHGSLNTNMKSHFQACEHNFILAFRIYREQDGGVRRGKLFRVSPLLWARSEPKEEVIRML